MSSGNRQREFKADWAPNTDAAPDPQDESDRRNWVTPEDEAKKGGVLGRLSIWAILAFVVIAISGAQQEYGIMALSLTGLIVLAAGLFFAQSWFASNEGKKKNLFFMKQGKSKYWGRGDIP